MAWRSDCTWTRPCSSASPRAVRCGCSVEENLADYCTALEGVSHFHYFVWSAARARNVSLLELELQAEVDKYASALRLTLEQREGRVPRELFHRLFDGASFLPHLTDAERRRYEEAHRLQRGSAAGSKIGFLRRRRARPEGAAGGVADVLSPRKARQAAPRGAVVLRRHLLVFLFVRHLACGARSTSTAPAGPSSSSSVCLPSAPLLYGL